MSFFAGFVKASCDIFLLYINRIYDNGYKSKRKYTFARLFTDSLSEWFNINHFDRPLCVNLL